MTYLLEDSSVHVEGDPGRSTPGEYLRSGGAYLMAILLALTWPSLIPAIGYYWSQRNEPAVWIGVLAIAVTMVPITWLAVLLARGSQVRDRRVRLAAHLAWWLGSGLALAVQIVGWTTHVDVYRSVTICVGTAAMGVYVVSWRWGLVAAVVATVLPLAVTGRVGEIWIFVTANASNYLLVRLIMWVHSLIHRMDLARRTIASLSVQQERQRFARDLHDVMGRSLSSIAVKAELGLASGDEMCRQQLQEVRSVAQDSLAQMRHLVSGYRAIDLDSELDDACAILRATGVYVEVDSDGGNALGEHRDQVGGWVVREAVTNVLRHAPQATAVDITVSGPTIVVSNDGVQSGPGEIAEGNGICGLRERVAAIGGQVSITRLDDAFRVEAVFPAQPVRGESSTGRAALSGR
ncbi:MAG: sensor histidine kinase [Actinomycetales bacterium]